MYMFHSVHNMCFFISLYSLMLYANFKWFKLAFW